ncbi:hypothetical protein M3G91_32065 [Micromonospora chalcea]|uniref:hypothetical protein n=1 Tax=Micromonospora chalcea TaxID=1874 RepID=UPI0021A40C54|nr:hypothetical protein [Micromonospora chalcea]MCT2282247.1 hypothetical protein [Micromonospora chalcea]
MASHPDRPYVMGMQWASLVADPVLLNAGSEVSYLVPGPGQPPRRPHEAGFCPVCQH